MSLPSKVRRSFADPLMMSKRLGLNQSMLGSIGLIASFAGNIEYRLEFALWALQGYDPKGRSHPKDGLPVSALIDEFKAQSSHIENTELCEVIRMWCEAAKPAFKCRNAIMHGISLPWSDQSATFMRNPRIYGELRKREYSEFHADEHTLTLMEGAFATLLRAIALIQNWANDAAKPDQDTFAAMMKALRDARSISVELVDLAAAVNHEKY